MEKASRFATAAVAASAFIALLIAASPPAKKSYDVFESPRRCAQCHKDIHVQWTQAMMSKAYTHHWDEIEYFKLAIPQAEKTPKSPG